MLDKILSKFDFNSPNSSTEVQMLLLMVWLLVVVCTIWSILSHEKSMKMKLLWIVIVVCFPFVGVIAYIPFSLSGELYPFIGFWRDPR